jgi:hypothetical protein
VSEKAFHAHFPSGRWVWNAFSDPDACESTILVLIWRFMLTSLRGGGCGTSFQVQGRRIGDPGLDLAFHAHFPSGRWVWNVLSGPGSSNVVVEGDCDAY